MIFQHHSEVIFKNKKHAAVMKNCSTTSLLCVGKTQGVLPYNGPYGEARTEI